MGLTFLCSNDNIHNEAHYVASNILFLSKRLNLFVPPLSGAGSIFE